MQERAWLKFEVFTADRAEPVVGAAVVVRGENNEEYHLVTDENGHTPLLELSAPSVDATLTPSYAGLPYGMYQAEIKADGYTDVLITGIQLFAQQVAIQPVEMIPHPATQQGAETESFVIPKNALLQTYENHQVYQNNTARVLKETVIPETITVHLGRPENTSARNVTVSFPDYIKNVASSEIYPTWPESSLRANIYAQISLALNRVFTEWYRSRGYAFDITNSTSFDQYFVYGRNIFENISMLVDEIFNTYIRKIGTINPYYAEYCNGSTVTCKGMSQWGTVTLAQNGYTPLRILQYYYGNDIELVTTNNIAGITASYPGTPLKLGSVSNDVIIISNQLNRIRRNYPAIPEITNVSSTFTAETQAAVKMFQKVFDLTQDGIVGSATWNKISYIYVAVKKLAELNSEGEVLPDKSPTVLLSLGSSGSYVELAQYFLRVISAYNPEIPSITIDGIFGQNTKTAVIAFQKAYGLCQDGVIGPKTWEALYSVYMGIAETEGLAVAYPGHLLKVGVTGANVKLMQSYLNTIGKYQPSIPKLTVDGVFGSQTKAAVMQYQRLYNLTVDGIIGKKTWDSIVGVRLLYGNG